MKAISYRDPVFFKIHESWFSFLEDYNNINGILVIFKIGIEFIIVNKLRDETIIIKNIKEIINSSNFY